MCVRVRAEANGDCLQGMTRMIHELASRRLADSLFLEDLGVDAASLISATKLILMELEEVISLRSQGTNLAMDGTDGLGFASR